jgi:outer membrane protein assembly factor BamA
MNVASANDTLRTKRFSILPFPNLGYSPETRWYAGGVALVTVRLYSDTFTRKSTFKAEVNVTQNKQLIGTLEHNVYFLHNAYNATGRNQFFKYPEYYWGLGLGNNTQDSAKELYDARRVELDNAFLKQWVPAFYGGVRYRLQYMYDVKSERDGLLDHDQVPGAGGGTSSGLGYALAYDSRDNVLNAKRGAYLTFSNLFYRQPIGSDFTFTSYETDLRKYVTLAPNHVLAGQLTAAVNHGNVPFRMMAMPGGESSMRGYYTGRFRDKAALTGQVEYRVRIWRFVGAALFGGGGEVASSLNNFSFSKLKPTYGGGIRLRVSKSDDVNLRFDYAVGKNTSGFYVAFGEAF